MISRRSAMTACGIRLPADGRAGSLTVGLRPRTFTKSSTLAGTPIRAGLRRGLSMKKAT